jgi:DNA-binding transcriptional ArsR family regulator
VASNPSDRPIDQRLVRALSHPLRVRILEILTERAASPNELVDVLEYPLGHIAYHSRVLEKCGCIELVRTAQRRGAVEHYFQASPRSFIGHQDWRRVPRSLLGNVSSASIQSFMDKVVAAAEAGTIDGREDTKLSWMPIVVDPAGWEQAGEIIDEAVARLQGVHEQSKQRLAQSDGEGTTMIIGFAGFEAARSDDA